MLTALTNAVFYTGEEEIRNKALLIENGIVKGFTDSIPSTAEVQDLQGGNVSAGLIDLQIYGGGGVMFSDNPSVEFLETMADGLMRTGTTGFLICLATNSLEIFGQAIDVVRDNPHPAVLGLHLEGPYINPSKRGAHLLQHIKKPTLKEVETLLERAKGAVKMMTIAPEMCDPEVIRLLLDHGVILSAGHSNATFAEGMKGFEQGIQTSTHLFNAMSPFHHRDTGLPGAVYHSNAYASIIPDGIHVAIEALQVSKQVMGERLFLITDAVEPSTGAYQHVRQEDRFTLPDGTLSGSAITMLQGIKNCVEKADIALDEALRMASAYPAKLMGMPERGKISIGQPANLTLFDEGYRPSGVFVNGTYHIA